MLKLFWTKGNIDGNKKPVFPTLTHQFRCSSSSPNPAQTPSCNNAKPFPKSQEKRKEEEKKETQTEPLRNEI